MVGMQFKLPGKKERAHKMYVQCHDENHILLIMVTYNFFKYNMMRYIYEVYIYIDTMHKK